ncbi:MAG TPA: alternative ribosome rescue aminoacyl-tRNA hydrolase ArfB [Acidimicrobiales bacterium]|nr:alternative ribosome rescue aminoacyl-tRNA hydrolase ArfB [Acidimicrobiales bacterium]
MRVSGSCILPDHELRISVSRSSGPGGQHVNTSNSRVEVTFDVANSTALGPRQKARLLEKLGPVVRVVASDERSQLRNKEIALARLAERLAGALRVEKPRVATRATKASKERRLDAKRRTSQIKAGRRGRYDD